MNTLTCLYCGNGGPMAVLDGSETDSDIGICPACWQILRKGTELQREAYALASIERTWRDWFEGALQHVPERWRRRRLKRVFERELLPKMLTEAQQTLLQRPPAGGL